VLNIYLDRRKSREKYKNREERYNIYRGLDKKIKKIEESSSKNSSSKDSSNIRAIEVVESKDKIV
jgi:hypothetical protein